ncbi:MAG: glycine cleavage system aminomethyltransferase GcvT, partial [Hadesarchaea archaeon]|nr:glycine cleavage system aminomethyltransferase GcvT [Hadesarchaea archaeon]
VSVKGEGAFDYLQRVTTNDVSKLAIGTGQYSTICNMRGGVIDDLIVYRVGEKKYMVVDNASNADKDFNWLVQQAPPDVEVEHITMTTLLFSLQGPNARKVLQKLTDFDLSRLKRYGSNVFMEVAGTRALVSRTGYTGEDGFEFIITDEPPSNPVRGERLWNALMHAGEPVGLGVCGLGARDTIRIEAGLCLYGHELTEDISPLEASIAFVVKLDKGEFIGREAMLKKKEKGLSKVRIGMQMIDRGIPHKNDKILKNGKEIGYVSSGVFSPLLKIGIAHVYVPPEISPGDEVKVKIRDRACSAEIINFPFYDPERYGVKRRGAA